jgi:hypothetical protein
MSEIYEQKILDYLPRITTNLIKKLKDNDSSLHQAISESFGSIMENGL